jgi:predicted nuclease of predicted toxin-antitoxin system
MKLLFDHNLSHKLVRQLADIFPDSTQTRLIAYGRSDDLTIWQYAKDNGFTVVSQDSDFYDISCLYGHPPKLIWLQCGNQQTAYVARLLRANRELITQWSADPSSGCIEIL